MQVLAVGLLFPEDVSKKIDEFRIRYGNPRIRAVVPHITLKQPFTSKVETQVVVRRLQSVAATTRPFAILLNRFGYFEAEKSLAFIAVDDPGPVSDLHSKIVQSLRGLVEGGDEHELDRYVPHVTVSDEIPRERLSSLKSELASHGFSMGAELYSFVLFASDGTGWELVQTFRMAGH